RYPLSRKSRVFLGWARALDALPTANRQARSGIIRQRVRLASDSLKRCPGGTLPRHPRTAPLGGPGSLLPAGLAQARHVAAHGGFAQLVAAQAELAVHATRAARQFATGALAARRRIARQLGQLGSRIDLLFVARVHR